MKLVTFAVPTPLGAVERLGALIEEDGDGRIADLTGCFAAHLAAHTDEPTPRELAELRTPPDMIGWLRGAHKSFAAAHDALVHVRDLLEKGDDPRGIDGERLVFAREDVHLMAPLPRPNSFRDFSIFLEHYTRSPRPFMKTEAWFKTPPYYKGNVDSFVGPEDPVPFPYYTEKLDLELEIGIVIGREGRNLTSEQARDHIAGFTILIDPSCRDGFERETLGPTKRKDWCTVIGPCLVTADEIDEAALNCRVTCNGETWFEGSTAAPRSFLAEDLVAYVSDNETIYPGDLIGTGTVGFGCSVDYHKWPKVGDRMTFTVDGIGAMTLEIVAGERVVEHVKGMKGLLDWRGEPVTTEEDLNKYLKKR